MSYTATMPPTTTPEQVLDGIAGARDQMRLLEQGLVVFAVEWVKLNPGEVLRDLPYVQKYGLILSDEEDAVWEALSDQGCLRVDDFSIPSFAIAAGISEHAARKLIRESLMLVCLLPRVWARVVAGGIEVWRARLLAADCWDLSPEAVEFVDRQMSEVTARFTLNAREAIITEAKRRYMPDVVAAEQADAMERRGVHIGDPLPEDHGVMPLWGHLEALDALDVDAVLTAGAQALKEFGSDAPVTVRRAWALGDLARSALGQGNLSVANSPHPAAGENNFDAGECSCTCSGHHRSSSESAAGPAPPPYVSSYPNREPSRPYWNGKAAPPRAQVFIHVNHTAIAGGPLCPSSGNPQAGPEVARVDARGLTKPLLLDPQRIKEWLTRPTLLGGRVPRVIVRPVLNLEDDMWVGAYEVPDRIVEHRMLTTGSCVFPHCTRPGSACDIDHTQPWKADGTGGATCTCNLAPLCRRHHRLKTHGDNAGEGHSRWNVVALGGGDYRWTGPEGIVLIRTNQGTWDASVDQSAAGPRHPSIHPRLTEHDHARTTRLADTETSIDALLRASLPRPVHDATRMMNPSEPPRENSTLQPSSPEQHKTVSQQTVSPHAEEVDHAPTASEQDSAIGPAPNSLADGARYDAALAQFEPYSRCDALEEYLHQVAKWHAIVVPRIPGTGLIELSLDDPHSLTLELGSQAA